MLVGWTNAELSKIPDEFAIEGVCSMTVCPTVITVRKRC